MNYTLITGASSGIGYELAFQFAKNGHNLILVARQYQKLLQLAEILKADYNVETVLISQDLSHPNAADAIFGLVSEKGIHVNYLVNNAGFYVKGAFVETLWEKEHELVQLQCLNHTKITKLLLPQMCKSKKGGILNICSTGSFVPGPNNAIYCAAKSFVLSFSEAIAEEVAEFGIAVTALCPSGTKTNFQNFDDRKESVLFPIMKASEVAKIGYNSLMKGKRVVVPGMSNKLQVFLVRFLPRKLVVKLTSILVKNGN